MARTQTKTTKMGAAVLCVCIAISLPSGGKLYIMHLLGDVIHTIMQKGK